MLEGDYSPRFVPKRTIFGCSCDVDCGPLELTPQI